VAPDFGKDRIMSNRTWKWVVVSLVAVAAVGLVGGQLWASSCCGSKAAAKPAAAKATSAHHGPEQALARLAGTLKAIDAAAEAVKAGKKDEALARLAEARKTVSEMHAGLAAHAKPVKGIAANVRCPIMGGKLNWPKITAKLTREYNGKTVGFCCGGCPARWDKLTDKQKDAALAKVAAK